MIKVGVIGLGYWGPNLVRNLAEIDDVFLHTVCDLEENRLKYVGKRYPKLCTTKRYEEILTSPEIDAIVIATPASSHFSLAKESLLHGKSVLVEKPLALSSEECQELIDLAEERGKVLMVGHTFIFNPAVEMLKDYVVRGELGDIFYIYSQRLNLGRIRQDVNAMWNFAPHDLSIVLYLLGETPLQVRAKGKAYIQDGIEDVVFLDLDFPSGVNAHVHISWLNPQKVRKTTVVGSKKMVIYDDVSSDAKIQIYDKGVAKIPTSSSPRDFETFGEFQLKIRTGDLHVPAIKFTEPLRNECSHFIKCVKEGKAPLTDGRHGMQVVKILEAAEKSMRANGIPQEVQ